MSEFIIVYTSTLSTAARQRLNAAYPAAYELVPKTVYLIRDSSLTGEIAVKVGIQNQEGVAQGAVFKLNHGCSGFTHRSLWEWLDQ